MNEFRATVAIVRRHIDRRFGFDWAMQFLVVAILAYVFARTFASFYVPVAIASALAAAGGAERTHAVALRRVSFFAMPLYGRQLARAHAIAPAVLATSIPLGYACGAALRGPDVAPMLIGMMALAASTATLIAISSAFRDGAYALLYGMLAIVSGIGVTLPFELHLPHGPGLALALAFAANFVALRAFGETLARYDPIPGA